MLFKLSYPNSNFALTPGYLNPSLNHPAQVKSHFKHYWSLHKATRRISRGFYWPCLWTGEKQYSGCVRLGNLDLDFENLNPDFRIERTLSITELHTVQQSVQLAASYDLAPSCISAISVLVQYTHPLALGQFLSFLNLSNLKEE